MNTNNQIEEKIKLCALGDAEAEKWLFKTYYSTLMTICLRYSECEDDAKDILNEGFLKIFQNIAHFNHQGSFEGWLKRIMVNSAIDFIRKQQKFKLSLPIHQLPDISDVANCVDAISLLSEKELLKLIMQLPHMSKSVFNLFVFDGYTHKEIATILGMKEGTSMWHLNNARNILKKQITQMSKVGEVVYG